MNLTLAFIGYGNVGQGLTEILKDKKELLEHRYNFSFKIVAIADKAMGSVFHEKGLDPGQLLDIVRNKSKLTSYPGAATGWNSYQTIENCNADVIIEITPTDINSGEPATSHIKNALNAGRHVITTNKGPSALHHKEIVNLAAENSVHYLYEGTVMSGTPLFKTAEEGLAGTEILGIRGIFNGTTNFILSSMENGMSYQDALQRAQQLGYAESDPAADVEGWDVAAKLLILANVMMGSSLRLEDISVTGIKDFKETYIVEAKDEGRRWKLIGEISRHNGGLVASVSPQKLDTKDPLNHILYTDNAVTFQTDIMGPVTLIGAGAGRKETGFSILSDLLEMHRLTETHKNN